MFDRFEVFPAKRWLFLLYAGALAGAALGHARKGMRIRFDF